MSENTTAAFPFPGYLLVVHLYGYPIPMKLKGGKGGCSSFSPRSSQYLHWWTQNQESSLLTEIFHPQAPLTAPGVPSLGNQAPAAQGAEALL